MGILDLTAFVGVFKFTFLVKYVKQHSMSYSGALIVFPLQPTGANTIYARQNSCKSKDLIVLPAPFLMSEMATRFMSWRNCESELIYNITEQNVVI